MKMMVKESEKNKAEGEGRYYNADDRC